MAERLTKAEWMAEAKSRIKTLEKAYARLDTERRDISDKLDELKAEVFVEENKKYIGKCYKYDEPRDDEHLVHYEKILALMNEGEILNERFQYVKDRDCFSFGFWKERGYLNIIQTMKGFTEISKKEYNKQLKLAMKKAGLIK